MYIFCVLCYAITSIMWPIMRAGYKYVCSKKPLFGIKPYPKWKEQSKTDKEKVHVGQCSIAIIVKNYIDGDGICSYWFEWITPPLSIIHEGSEDLPFRACLCPEEEWTSRNLDLLSMIRRLSSFTAWAIIHSKNWFFRKPGLATITHFTTVNNTWALQDQSL